MTEITANTDIAKIQLWEDPSRRCNLQSAGTQEAEAKYYMGVPIMAPDTPVGTGVPISPPAFVLALAAAPIITALPGILLLYLVDMLNLSFGAAVFLGIVLVGAGVVGSIPYLLIGVPGLIYALRKYGRYAPFGRLALLGHVCSLPVIFVGLFVLKASDEVATTFAYGLLGCAFAPVWGVLFAAVYFSLVGREGGANV